MKDRNKKFKALYDKNISIEMTVFEAVSLVTYLARPRAYMNEAGPLGEMVLEMAMEKIGKEVAKVVPPDIAEEMRSAESRGILSAINIEEQILRTGKKPKTQA